MDDFLAAWTEAQRGHEDAREATRRRVLLDPVAYAVVTTFQRTLAMSCGRTEAYRADAILDGTTAILALLDMAHRGELP